MKIIYFWGTPPPPIGGMTVHIERLAFHLSKNKWKIIERGTINVGYTVLGK